MSDHIDRVAEVIYDSLSGKYGDFNMPTEAAQALDAADWLATPEHDREIAERAWNRGVSTGFADGWHHLELPNRNPYEREGGAS